MKRLLSMLIICLLCTGGLSVFSVDKAYACSCVYMGDIPAKLESYSTVFSGQVVRKGAKNMFQSNNVREYTFEVQTAWKGVTAKKMKITANDGGEESCGVQFAKGESYLIFASLDEKDGKSYTSYCSGNLSLKNASASEAIKLLGTGVTVSEDYGEQGSVLSPLWIWISGGGSVLLLAALFVVWRRKRKG